MGNERGCQNQSRRIVTVVLTLVVLWGYLPCAFPSAEEYDFWVQTPTDWTNKTEGLGRDLKKQVMSPAGDAFIEVYAARGNNISAQAIADGMEQAMRQRDTAYLQNRISSKDITADGQPAVLREYTGLYNGIPLRAYALYAYGNGGGFAVFGVFVAGQSAKYQDRVYTCVTSLRFSPPGGQAPASTGSSPYGGTGSPYAASPDAGCNAIVGQWKWFTGSTAQFDPNGAIPGAGSHWECLDNGRTFKISWDNGRWIDTLTLTEDGTRLEGKNQVGNRVWGTRIGAPPAAGGNGRTQNSWGGNDGPDDPERSDADQSCCSYYGLWNFVPPGIHGIFMPDHQYTERSKGFRYDCAGGQVTIHWGGGGSTTWQRKNKDLMVRTDKYGSVLKATRLEDEVTYKGRRYKACTGDAAPSSGNVIPKANGAKKISGNMAAQWGFAHGSLKPGDPSKWELSTVSGTTLNFKDPYNQGKQHYTVRAYSSDGSKVAETAVGMAASLSLPPGQYTLEISTGIHYAGWRCEWQ